MTSTATTGIRQISLVCVPTPDQDKAIEFYESIGFEKRTDTPFGGGYRWVEIYPGGDGGDRAGTAAARDRGQAGGDRDHADHRRHRCHSRRFALSRAGC